MEFIVDKKRMYGLFPMILLVFIAGCSGTPSLNQTEKEKLDPPLQQVLSGMAISATKYDVSLTGDGTKIYGVIIRAKNIEEITSLGIGFNSHQGEMITAKLTAEEIRQLVNLNSVIRVEIGSKTNINQ
jgi:hypothetical protein